MYKTLEKAIELALIWHSGQVDKSGQAYILHPLRVMLSVKNNDDRVVAVLHDVVEDTACTLEALKGAGFSDKIIHAIDALTRREEETYQDFILRAKKNEIARRVKIADINDNLRPGGEHLKDRYLKALKALSE